MTRTDGLVHDQRDSNDEGRSDMRALATRIKTLILGPRCELGCGAHVYYKDVQWHRDEQCTVVRRDA